MRNNKIKTVAIFGVMLALYVAVSTMFHIPMPIGHSWFDMGYVVYGFMLTLFGPAAIIIGALGVLLENIMFSGWISYSWIAGQIVIGVICGLVFSKTDKFFVAAVPAAIATWIGIGLVKTLIEIAMGYGVFSVKIVNNSIYALADYIPLMIGYIIAKKSVFKKNYPVNH